MSPPLEVFIMPMVTEHAIELNVIGKNTVLGNPASVVYPHCIGYSGEHTQAGCLDMQHYLSISRMKSLLRHQIAQVHHMLVYQSIDQTIVSILIALEPILIL